MGIVLIVALVAAVYVLAWALCRAASDGDTQLALLEEELSGGPETT